MGLSSRRLVLSLVFSRCHQATGCQYPTQSGANAPPGRKAVVPDSARVTEKMGREKSASPRGWRCIEKQIIH